MERNTFQNLSSFDRIDYLGVDTHNKTSNVNANSNCSSNLDDLRPSSTGNTSPHYRLFRSSTVRSSSAADFLSNKSQQSSEAKAIDRMFEDLSQYEHTVNRLSNTHLNDRFKDELQSSESWFSTLNECERMTVIYSFLPYLNSVQKRFFHNVIGQQLESENIYSIPPSQPPSKSESVYSSPSDDSSINFHLNRNGMRLFSRHSFTGSNADRDKIRENMSKLSTDSKQSYDGFSSRSFSNGLFSPIPTRPILTSTESFLSINSANSNISSIHRSSTPVNGLSTSPSNSPIAKSPTAAKSNSSYASAVTNTAIFSKFSSNYSSSQSSPREFESKPKSPLYSVLTPLSGNRSFDKLDKPETIKKEESINLELLEDIPGWLKSLRLHKYTTVFQGMHWKEMIELQDHQLEAKGVSALGARRKLLKVFDQIKEEINNTK